MLREAFLALMALACVFAAGQSRSELRARASSAEPDLRLSLGSIYSARSALPHAASSLASTDSNPNHGSSSQALISPSQPREQPDLDLTLGTLEQARSDALRRRLTELRNDLDRHFETNRASLPGTVKYSKKWYEENMPLIKQRALQAFQLRQKYQEVVHPYADSRIWTLEAYQSWQDSVADDRPWPRHLKHVRLKYAQVREQIALIETMLMKHEKSFSLL